MIGARNSTTSPAFRLRADADDPVAFAQQFLHRDFLDDLRALRPGVVQQHLVELRAQHLPGLRHGARGRSG